MVKVIGITQARIGSSRLPGKVLLPIDGRPILSYHLSRCLQSKLVCNWIVATTWESGSEEICSIASQHKALCYHGDTNDVLGRFFGAAEHQNADYVVRITSDCPLIDPCLIDDVVKYAIENNFMFASTSGLFPDGVDVEVFSSELLSRAFHEAQLGSDREHVTAFMRRAATAENLAWEFNPRTSAYSGIRMTVDEKADYDAITVLISRLGADKTWSEYADCILQNPELFSNQNITRNQGLYKSLANDKIAKH